MGRKLPVIRGDGSLRKDGSHVRIHPADVQGRFQRVRTLVFAALIIFYLALPWIRIDGDPLVFLDIPGRRFFLFGGVFGAQDGWLLVFVLLGVALTLVGVTAVWGRVWCGYACPQTVFLEGVFRNIERWIEGNAAARRKLDAAPLSPKKALKKLTKHVLFLLVALLVAHVFVSLFVSLPTLVQMVQSPPSENPIPFAWMAAMTLIMYGNFAWFREQLCLVICPYGRLQSALIDDESLVIGYDERRGEPRGKVSDPNAGDCINCFRCVDVCPTGIDIRNGLQMECIGCAACIDACDEIMQKVNRPTGLIRYDSLNGLAGEPTKRFRPRVAAYLAIGIALTSVGILAAQKRTAFEANLLRLPGPPFVVEGDTVRNMFNVHITSKSADPMRVELRATAPSSEVSLALDRVDLEPFSDKRITVVVQVPKNRASPPDQLTLEACSETECKKASASIQLPASW